MKVFNYMNSMRPTEEQMRELEILTKLHHENVVTLLDIEEEVCKILTYM